MELIFATIEEKLYQNYPEYRKTNNIFIANGKSILKLKIIRENNLGAGKAVILENDYDKNINNIQDNILIFKLIIIYILLIIQKINFIDFFFFQI